jgi:hypothetical protein
VSNELLGLLLGVTKETSAILDFLSPDRGAEEQAERCEMQV